MTDIDDFQIHRYKDTEIKNALVILSFPTIGMISNIVANYLIKNFELDRIGAILSDSFQPSAIIKKGMPSPPVRIYAGDHVCGPDGECDQIIVITSDLPLDKKILPTLADKIIEWSKEQNVENIVTIEGINNEDLQLGEDAKVYHVTSSDNSEEVVLNLTTEELKDGVVSGLSGLLLWKGNLMNFPIISILAEAHQKFPDSRSAASVLSALNKMLPEIDMDPEPLLDHAEQIEEEIRKAMSQMQNQSDQSVGRAAQGFFA